ncbi:MAG: hypothetical protein DDT23_00367 [candidate division WS2 bacterium]|nr:hypothetical protein [Candidatus Lithacetigena glycinireducens]
MSKYYTLKEVRALRDKISKLGERKIDELEAKYEKAEEEYDEAEAEHYEHYGTEGEYGRTEAELDKIAAERDKARAERNKARAEYEKVGAEYDVQLFTLLTSCCPKAHYWDWEGYLAISKSKKDDWIIPVFAGDFNGIKHKAFSIWEMPKDSCDKKDMKEVKDE